MYSDVYSTPKNFDLDLLWEFELSEPCWDFNMVVVWRHLPTWKLYWASDSGCSCPSPFEDFTSLDKLDELTTASYPALEEMVKSSERRVTEDAQKFLRLCYNAVPR